MNLRALRDSKPTFFEGFCSGLIALTSFIVFEYGLGFELINSAGFFNFRHCFRALTLMILIGGMMLLYRFSTYRNGIGAFCLTLLVFCYFDTAFVAMKQSYIPVYNSYYFLRNFLMSVGGLYGLILNRHFFKARLNINYKASAILLIMYIPFIYWVMGDFLAVTDVNWYSAQYADLRYTIDDILLKITPFICLLLPNLFSRKEAKKI
jgi:hypothetical protein